MTQEHTYTTSDGEPIPDKVAAQFAHPDDWDWIDPTQVPVVDLLWDDLYHGFEKDTLKEVLVDDRGKTYDYERFERVTKLESAAVPDPERFWSHLEPFTYNDSPDLVGHDHFAEHVTKVIVVEEDEITKLNSRSGVLWFDYESNEGSNKAIELAISLAETRIPHETDNCEIERPDWLTKASGGWHSSMEKSEQSELINALCKGDIDPAWKDEIDPYPYVVRFGDTTNVCAQPVSVWSSHELAVKLEDALSSKRAAPAYAGLR